jgi:hypothetical protein
MNVELTFKPIYKPLLAEALAISISNSDVRDKLIEYYLGRINENELRNILNKIINTKYLFCIENRCLGDNRIKGEEITLPFMTKENKKMNIKVVVA